MKFSILLIALLSTLSFAQIPEEDMQEYTLLTLKIAQKENLFKVDSGKVKAVYTQEDIKAVTQKYLEEYANLTKFRTKDVIYGSLWAISAGIGEGFYESAIFYPHNNNFPSWMNKYLQWDINSDQIFCKIFTAQKIFRDLDYTSNSRAYARLRRFYNSGILAYLHNFVVRSTVASIIRSQAKYGTPWHDFSFDLLVPSTLFKELGL